MSDRPDERSDLRSADEAPEAGELLLEYDQWLVLLRDSTIRAPQGAESSVGADGDLSRDIDFLRELHHHWARGESSPTGQADSDREQLAPTANRDPPGTGEVTRNFGRFEIVREIGRGGAGIVFLARDPLLRREVALKVPLPDALLSPDLRRRFLREGAAAARLNHPGIIPVYEAGEAGIVCYIASAFCPGPTLAEWLQRRGRPLSPELSAGLVRQLAEAVQYAHSRGVLHRDIKPANVLCEPPTGPVLAVDEECAAPAAVGPTGQVDETRLDFVPRLTDFGLAHVLGQETCLTRANAVLGTPRYMAPEQAAGRQAEIGTATDVYALGAVLYELLAGRAPFGGKSALETLRQVLDHDPPPLKDHHPRVPADLEAIVLRCLDKSPAGRYRSAGELADDLQRFLQGEPTVARPLARWVRAGRWCRRRPAVAALLAILLFVSAVGFVTVTWQWRRAEGLLAIAEEERSRAEARLRGEESLLTEVFRLDADLSGGNHRNLRGDVRERMRSQFKAAMNHAKNPADMASAAANYAILRVKQHPSEAVACANRSCQLWEQLLRDFPRSETIPLQLANAYLTSAYVNAIAEDHASSLQRLAEARRTLERDDGDLRLATRADDYRRIAEAHWSIGAALRREFKIAESKETFRHAARYAERLVALAPAPLHGRLLSRVLRHQASLAVFEGKSATAEKLLLRAVRTLDVIDGQQAISIGHHKERAEVYSDLGHLYVRRRDQWDDAERYLREATRLFQEIVQDPSSQPPDVRDVARATIDLAIVCQNTSKREEATALLAEADRLSAEMMRRYDAQETRGENAAELMTRLAELKDDLRQPRAAIASYRLAAELYQQRSQVNPNRPDLTLEQGKCLFWVGRLQEELGEYEHALDSFQQARLILERPQQNADADRERMGYLARMQIYSARICLRLGNPPLARDHYAQAQTLYEAILAERPDETGFRRDLDECNRYLAAN